MQFRSLYKQFFIIPFVSFIVSSCLVDTAEMPKKQSVTIYSDCLSKEDISLFHRFRNKEHIRVKIIHLPADSILKIVQSEGYNTRADVIILKSLYDTQRIHKAKILNPIKSWKLDELVNKKFKSKDNTWFGIGVNPYVFVAENDTVSTISEIGELLHKKNRDEWSTNLETSTDLVPLLAPVLQKKKRSEAIEWYMDFMENDHAESEEYDKNGIAIMTTNMLVTSYTTYVEMTKRNDSTDFHLHLSFPNQSKKGAFYNLICAGIVKQARNYENAKLLIEYLSTIHMNEKINNRWNTFPISLQSRTHPYAYQNTTFKIYKGFNSNIIVNYPNLNRIIKKKRKRPVVERRPEIIVEVPEMGDTIEVQGN